MIEQLLRLLTEGGVQSYEDLAKRLSVSIPLLEMMLEDLSRLGYLSPVDSDCGTHCASCSIGSCSITGPGRLWALTDKGARAAARLD
jgi:hypothetical protein